MSTVMDKDYFKTLKDIVPGGDKAKNLKDLIASMTSEPTDIMAQYEDSGVLDLMREDMQGMTAQERSATIAPKRQELAAKARAGGGTTILGGQSRDFSTTKSQFELAMDQATKIQEVDQQNIQEKEAAEEKYLGLRNEITLQQQKKEDDHARMINELALNFATIANIEKGS